MAGLLDYLEAIGETGAMLGTGAVSGAVGMPYGVYKGIRSGKYGTPEGVRIAEEEARRFMERNTYQPRSQMAQNAIGYAGGLLSDARIPPIIPEAAALSAIPLRPAARMAGEGVAATGRFVAPKAGQLAEQYMVNTGAILPLDVYHGTPHTLPPTPRNPLGEFDASKIGTGEGAQAFGHGIYTAESPNVARGYAEQLSTAQGPLGDVAKYWRKNGGESAFRAFAKDAGLPPAEIENTANVIRNTGNLYKVDLPDEKIAKMLDWDKPLSQQPANVRKALAQYMDGSDTFISPAGGSLYNPNGKQIYESITGGADAFSGKGSEISAKKLRELGIPGIQYLDEGSRSAGKGTRNFVVFPGEEKNMTILERNGQRAEELKRLQAGGLLAP